MYKLKINTAGFQQRIRHVRANMANAIQQAIYAYGTDFTRIITRAAPRDTNRYVRGWIEAAVSAGIPAGTLPPMPPLNRSSRRDQFIRSLQEQLDSRERYLEVLKNRKAVWYDRKPDRPRRGYYNTLVDLIKKQERKINQARRILTQSEGSENFIFVPSGLGKRRRTDTVRTRVYGGTGSLTISIDGQRAVLMLQNNEIHSRFIERRTAIAYRSRQLAHRMAERKMLMAFRRGLNKGVAA